MVNFDYIINQQLLKIEASSWCGLERVFLNGHLVSFKFNFGRSSRHIFSLNNGQQCQLTLHIDPDSHQLRCRIYKNQHLLTSLVQGAEHLRDSQRQTKQIMVVASLGLLFAISVLLS
ncbi:hypothetical protein [Shewanella sp. NIFS-20-20]|uniref:hypothetical protein n=1 Tax=Shewanella sp. NIFS-20-20 TaxID=2853806 RepID=UPI001C444960|nr:hypothetical protein [Shewanella sp. NIFS-20-20]MBV7314571.1 hypothetical protein [Shewanella sp. NIFS-20-20]